MNDHVPLISVGLPVYNGEKFLSESIESILSQSYPHFELIISDNASTDGTETICRSFASRDARIRYYRNDANLGAAWNHNRVFTLSSGAYFKWAAADDVCLPELLSQCLDLLQHDPSIVLAYPQTKFIDQESKLIDVPETGYDLHFETAYERLKYVIQHSHWVNVLFGAIRRDALLKTRLLPSYSGGDYRLLGELSLLGKFAQIPRPLFLRRLHPEASSQNATVEWDSQFHRGGRRRIWLPDWSLAIDHFGTIIRAQLSFAEKCSLIGCVARKMYWIRGRLWKELKTTLKPSTNAKA